MIPVVVVTVSPGAEKERPVLAPEVEVELTTELVVELTEPVFSFVPIMKLPEVSKLGRPNDDFR